jgi:hypothetical protein
MGVITHQRPSVDGSFRVFSQCSKAGDEIVAVQVVVDYLNPLNTAHYHMV